MAARRPRGMLEVIKSKSAVGARLIAARPVPPGSPFFRIRRPRFVLRPTYQTVQVALDRHALSLGALTYINHSCLPNVIVDTKRMVCWALRDISKGEELSYFYPSTEWVMARPFLCLCGAANCIRIVAGARQLSTDVLSRYFINEHIRVLIGQELSAASRSWIARLVAADHRPSRSRQAARI
jgi:SET domain